VFLLNLILIHLIEIFPVTNLGCIYKIRPSDALFNTKTFMYSEPNILRQAAAIRAGLAEDKLVLE
jgi:hypothetical protein